jgi:hypothetical protein
MRRVITFLLLVVLAVGLPATAAVGASAARTVCTITDPRAIGLSGLVVTNTGYISMSDSNFDKSKIRIFYFDRSCKLLRTVGYPTAAYDPEDVAIGRDGTLYVADIGDNASQRSSIAVWRLAPGSKTPKIFRYAYPDHAHDAEALVLAGDDTPIFVTKDIGIGHLFVPTKTADPSGKPVPLRAAGSFTPTDFNTPNGIGLPGGLLITGGANSPDRSKVVLRTYSTAYEWSVVDGDVAKTITTTAPTVTPLPNEPQGEGIAYSLDGTSLLTVSDLEVDPVKTKILEYASGLTSSAARHSTATLSAVATPTGSHGSGGLPGTALGVIAAAGALLVAGGVVGIARARRRRA